MATVMYITYIIIKFELVIKKWKIKEKYHIFCCVCNVCFLYVRELLNNLTDRNPNDRASKDATNIHKHVNVKKGDGRFKSFSNRFLIKLSMSLMTSITNGPISPPMEIKTCLI